jgi:hypothetical protein
MAFANKPLASGLISNSPVDVLAPSGKTDLVHNITLFNKTVGNAVLKISRYINSTTLQLVEFTIATKKTVILNFGSSGWVIASGDKIIMESDTASSINYVIDGVEET